MKLVLFVLCTSAAMIMAQIPEDFVRPGFVPTRKSKTKLGLCESDCDRDNQCQPGLICAGLSKHRKALRKLGLDGAANCYSVVKPKNFQVCFNPTILNSGGAGGGKSWIWLVLHSISFLLRIKTYQK
jgi:hypothetical protein